MTGNLEGNVTLAKRLLKHAVWSREDYARAWVTFLLLANDKPRTVTFNGEMVELKRGELIRSCPNLQKMFNRSRNWVEAFLNFCVENGMIQNKPHRFGYLITVLNYSAYNVQQNGEEAVQLRSVEKEHVHRAERPTADPVTETEAAGPFPEFPSDADVADFCSRFTDTALGIASIPEVWWRGWLAMMIERPQKFPKNWKSSLKQRFLADWISGHSKARGQAPAWKESALSSDRLRRERGEIYQLLGIYRKDLNEAVSKGEPTEALETQIDALEKELAALPQTQ